MAFTCRICRNADANQHYRVREMMLGTRDEFDYVQCGKCGCLQIKEVPDNLGEYYPQDYYSFRERRLLSRHWLRASIDRLRVEYHLTGRSLLGRLADRLAQPLVYTTWIEQAGVGRDARILDVGCGGGKLILRMTLGGFRHCMGLDPFIPNELHYPNGVRVLKQDLIAYAASDPACFDLIMFHHSYEHLVDAHANLRAAAELLNPGGCILIRIPLADSYCWEHYRENWVNLDAPRHLYLHTNKSVALLAEAAGLFVDSVEYDSTASQLIGSELYVRDISMDMGTKSRDVFSRHQLAEFRAQAVQLNETGRGDMAAFYLRKRA